ncbi:MAG: hypothetical protein EA366_01805 [Spirulina sp. DLM2.Bin59]|nr:MAG: hypothetical protein EA366_01805 [Spirulina sp. DLM2.Bin59]
MAILSSSLVKLARFSRHYAWLGAILAFGLVLLFSRGFWHGVALDIEKHPQIYTVQPQIIAVEINIGVVERAQQVNYQSRPGDRIIDRNDGRWVQRMGQVIGNVVGPAQNLLYGFDQYSAEPLNTEQADRPDAYSLRSADDPAYETPQTPMAVYRKSKPTDMAQVSQGERQWPLRHRLYLEFAQPLDPGKTYELTFPGSNREPLTLHYDPQHHWSEAVHVSQVGFRPDDPVKLGFLSLWMGNGGGLAYGDGLQFSLIAEGDNPQQRSDRPLFTGRAEHRRGPDDLEDPRDRNYTHTDVYTLDFSSFRRPGRYRLCVAGVGCSWPFEIAPDVWKNVFYTVARGFYHQRSGIAFTAPYTDWERPRPFHPEDTPIYQSRVSLMETNMGIGDRNVFEALQAETSTTPVPEAWGGYFDAGDWDRRIQHLEATRLLLELVEISPKITEINLNIPESRNALPDIIDEALWNLSFYKRLQLPNGGIRGGIESTSHPRRGETSWQNTLPTYVYAPDPWSSYLYAGGAAQAAWILRDRDRPQAEEYQRSAIAAMNYAEAQWPQLQASDPPHQVLDARNLAAVELYRLTGDPAWHQIFLATTVFTDPQKPTMAWGKHHQRDAAFVYARLLHSQVDLKVQSQVYNALIREANRTLALSDQTAFGWTKDDPYQPIGWGASFGSPKAIALVRAHVLSGDARYRNGAIFASQFSLGANPDNLTYTTGLGHNSPQHPLILDARVQGKAPPPGIPLYGPLDIVRFPDYWMFNWLRPVTFPDVSQWPTTEAYFDVFLFPAVTEFTVMQSMGPATYTWGYLAATDP